MSKIDLLLLLSPYYSYQPTRLSQRCFTLNDTFDVLPDELGMGVWCSKSPGNPSTSGDWNSDTFNFSIGLDIGDISDMYVDNRLDERIKSCDAPLSVNSRERSGSGGLFGSKISKIGGTSGSHHVHPSTINTTNLLSNETKESSKSPARSPKSPTLLTRTNSKSGSNSPFSPYISPFISGLASTHSTEYLPPTWEPQSDFCFPVAELPVARFVPDNIELNHFREINHIADGSNANIFLALFDDEKVIIKMIREEVQTDPVAVHEFDVEHGILVRVSHPHIIKIIAAGRIPRRFVVLEFLGSGSLNSILSANIKKPTFIGKYCHRPTFGFFNLLSKAKDLASALDYLHKRANKGTTIIHRGKVFYLFVYP